MFDFHNHFTSENAFQKTGSLLPQYYRGQEISKEISDSEIGLDRRYFELMKKEDQISLFQKCLKIAKEKNIQIHVHCVGMVQDTIICLREANLKRKQVIWHRFNGSFEVAKELNKLGVIISISNDYGKDIKRLYENNPLLVLETDYEGTDKEEHSNLIFSNYLRTANALNMNIQELETYFKSITKFV